VCSFADSTVCGFAGVTMSTLVTTLASHLHTESV